MPTHIEDVAQDLITQVASSDLDPEAAALILQEAFYKGMALANQKVAPRQKTSSPPALASDVHKANDEAALSNKIAALAAPKEGGQAITPEQLGRTVRAAKVKDTVGGMLGVLGNQAPAKVTDPHAFLAHPQRRAWASQAVGSDRPKLLKRYAEQRAAQAQQDQKTLDANYAAKHARKR